MRKGKRPEMIEDEEEKEQNALFVQDWNDMSE